MAQLDPAQSLLPAFPEDGAERAVIDPELAQRGYALRHLELGDLSWLRALYASTRADEMAQVPWPDATKSVFLNQQFDLQHRHYLSHFPTAMFLAIEHQSMGPVGRLYVNCSAPQDLLIDICLLPSSRDLGLGSTLVRQCQDLAAGRGHGMALHVLHSNSGAQRLYGRLGFRTLKSTASHSLMVWQFESQSAPSPATTRAG